MIKKFLLIISSLILTSGILIFSVNLADDYFSYKSIMQNTYDTPWYDDSWVKQPYTSYQISKYEHKIYETENAVGSTWVVKETDIQGKKFWTIIEILKKD